MRIVFNLMNVGAGNNGGTHTLIQSANTLHDLGEDVVIIDSGKCQYTWDSVKVPYKRVNNVNDVSGDVIIATGTGSVKPTNESNILKKYHWIRGWELWNTPEDKLVKLLKQSPCKKIVNSICLKRRLNSYDIPSEIIRPGHSFEEFKEPAPKRDKPVALGGLYNQGTKRLTKRTNWILDSYNILKYKYNLQLWMFGADGTPPLHDLIIFVKNPNVETKIRFYNNIDIWLSPSELEGLHIAPAESMLCECCVVGNNSPMGGTEDYLIDHETGLVSENTFESFLANVEILIKHKVLREELAKAGRKKILELGDRKENMKKMLELIKG